MVCEVSEDENGGDVSEDEDGGDVMRMVVECVPGRLRRGRTAPKY